MKTKMLLVAGLVVITGAIIAVVVNMNRPVAPVVTPVVAAKPATSTAPPPAVASVPKTPAAEITAPIPVQPAGPAKSNAAVKLAKAQADQPIVINGYAVQDPDARLALSYVGSDPDADAYWASAINNPNLPSEERKDLIEDLNEDGLSDPQHPGTQDMPLILARIRLIEQLAPRAMDQVNADAFAEAEKDLVAMANGQPPP